MADPAVWITGTGPDKQLNFRLPTGGKGDKGDKGDKGADGSNVLPTDTAIKQAIDNPASETRGALNATFDRVFAMPAPSGSATTDAANLDALITKATAVVAAGGRPQITFQSGIYLLNAGIPVREGVGYRGVEPVIRQVNNTTGTWLADGPWNYAGGTVIKGNGTGRFFAKNNTDLAELPANIGDTQIANVTLECFGVDGFIDGIAVGAKNTIGLVYSKIDKIYLKNCSNWGVNLVNYAHCEITNIYTSLCQNGQRHAASLPAATFMPGNSAIGEFYHLLPSDGRDNRLCRGIVFEVAGVNAKLNEINARRIQSNGFNRAKLSVTATFTSGSTSVAVPDGTKFAAGMPVTFTTTNYGYTAVYTYIVLSVSGNTLTLGNSRTTAAISATGSGTLTLETYGFPNFEFTSENSGAQLVNSRFPQIDSEGYTTNAIYVENASACEFIMGTVPELDRCMSTITARNATYSRFTSKQAAKTDFDGNTSGTSEFSGTRSTTIQRPARGLWRDVVLNTDVLQLRGGTAGMTGGDIHSRSAGFMYPAAGMGERIYPRDVSSNLSGATGGTVVFAGATGQTMQLPTIVDADASPATSLVGLVFDIWNVSANSLAVATGGSQTFNKVAAKTSTTIAAGTSMRVIACKDNSGNLFWAARQTVLTLP